MRQQTNTGIETFLVLALVAALPVAFASGFTSYEALKGGILLLGGALLFVAWAVGVVRAGSVHVRSVLGLVALLALFAFALVSSLWAPNGWDALIGSGRWLALVAVGLTLLAPTGKPPTFGQLVIALSVGAGVSGVIGVLDVFGIPLDASAPGEYTDGFRGTFDNDRLGPLSLAATVPVLASAVLALRSPARFAAAVALVPVGLYIGATGQWDVGVMALGGVGVAAVLIAARRRAALVSAVAKPAAVVALTIALGVGGFFAAKALAPKKLVQVAGKVIEAKDPARTRPGRETPLDVEFGRPDPPRGSAEGFHARSTGWQMFTRHVVGGVGVGNFEVAQVGDLDVSSTWYHGFTGSYPGMRLLDNSALELMAELGIIGLLLLLLFIGVVVRAVWVRTPDADGDDVVVDAALLSGFAAVVIGSGLGGVLQTTVGAVALVVFGAALLGRTPGDGWELGKAGSFERMGLGLALPLAAAALLAYVGVAATASDYFKARGDVWVRAGALDRSQDAYQSALAWWAGNDEAALSYGIVTTARSKGFVEEERSLLAALELRPFDPRLFKALGQVQVREAVERKKKKAPALPDGGEQPDPAKMLQMLELVDKAVLNKAKANFGRAVELHPRYVDARESEANAFLLTGEPAKHQTALLKTIDMMGDVDAKRTARIHASLAQSYVGAEDWPRARKHIERALTLDPEHPRRKSLSEDLAMIHAHETGIKPKKDPHGH